jgi:hypothetical protein
MICLLAKIALTWMRKHHRALGALPSPTKPRPAGVWSLYNLPEAGKPAAGWGGVGGGGRAILSQVAPSLSHRTTPTPALRADPPHKGEGRTEFAARAVPSSASASAIPIARSVYSPPQPNPGLPGFGHFTICRKRASPQPAGKGLGVGVARFLRRWRQHHLTAPPPSPPLPRKRGRVQTEFVACADSTPRER